MSDPRIQGLLLMAISVATFLGTTQGELPAAAFFPALLLFVVGAIRFLRKNHEALARAERKAARAVQPRMRENPHARVLAERQARAQGSVHRPTGSGETGAPALGPDGLAQPIELDLDEDDLEVRTDVSFPVEVQRGDALADQLRKLNQMVQQGVLSEEEYAIAKAKLLD